MHVRCELKRVMWEDLRDQTRKLISKSSNRIYNDFKISNCWIFKFLKRNEFCIRSTTHKAQENRKTQVNKAEEIISYLKGLFYLTKNFPPDLIFQMDETPTYIDMIDDRTIDKRGVK